GRRAGAPRGGRGPGGCPRSAAVVVPSRVGWNQGKRWAGADQEQKVKIDGSGGPCGRRDLNGSGGSPGKGVRRRRRPRAPPPTYPDTARRNVKARRAVSTAS